mgnify:CR=1 FL=1
MDFAVLTRKAVLIAVLAGFTATVVADDHYESVVKDADFRASLALPADATFVELSEGMTYYRSTGMESCDTPDVLVHGFSVPSYIWDPTYDFLGGTGRGGSTSECAVRGDCETPEVSSHAQSCVTTAVTTVGGVGRAVATCV